MKRQLIKRIRWGAYTDKDLGISLPTQAQGTDGNWYNARPIPYYSLITRIKLAWDVFRYKADPLYWEIDFSDDYIQPQ
jgi:hypothetical protein